MLRLIFAVMLLGTTLTTYTQPTVIQTKVATATSAAGASITFMQTPTPGDLELCSATHNAGSSATITFAAGFTSTASGQVNVSTSLGAARAYHVIGSSESPTIAMTTGATVGSLIFGCEEVAYVNTSSPIMADGCVSSASPAALFSAPTLQPLAPTVASSLFAALGTLTDTPQNGAVTNFDTSTGTLNARDQHSTPIYAFQNPFSAALQYNVAPSAAIACTTLFTPIITPFTIPVVPVVATPTPAPTATPAPTPTPPPGILAHVMTADYLWNAADKYGPSGSHVFTSYAPYLTYAYPEPSEFTHVHAAGIKTVAYYDESMPQTYTSNTEYGYTLLTSTYTDVRAKDCSGAIVTAYSGHGIVSDPRATNWTAYANADLGHIMATTSNVDLAFVDNAGVLYNVAGTPCGYALASWGDAFSTHIASVGTTWSMKFATNSLGASAGTQPTLVNHYLSAANVVSGQFEVCFNDTQWTAEVDSEVLTVALLKAQGKVANGGPGWWCYLDGGSQINSTADGASMLTWRMYAYASFLLGYDPGYSTYQVAFSSSPSGVKVFPETGFVPYNPTVTATTSHTQLACGSVYCRAFADCYYRGVRIGSCETVVNASKTTTYAIPSNAYTAAAVLAGDGVLDGGTMTFSGAKPTTLAPLGGAILIKP